MKGHSRRSAALVVLICLQILIRPPQSSAMPVTDIANVRCTSWGATGVESRVNVLDRHRYGEFYLVYLRNEPNSTSTWPCVFGFEIAQSGGGGDFKILVHIKYPKSSGYYAPKYEYIQWVDVPISTGWHTLRLQRNATAPTWCDGYLDGNWIGKWWWPYPNDNSANTQIEAYWESDDGPYFFMGRHDDFKLRTATGAWSLMDTSWSHRLYQYCPPPPYAIRYNAPYYDWEARTN